MIKYVFFLGYATSWVTDNVQLIKYDCFSATGSDAVQGGSCRITCSSPLTIRGGGLANNWRRLCTWPPPIFYPPPPPPPPPALCECERSDNHRNWNVKSYLIEKHSIAHNLWCNPWLRFSQAYVPQMSAIWSVGCWQLSLSDFTFTHCDVAIDEVYTKY